MWVRSGAEQQDLPQTVLEVTEKGLQDEASVPAWVDDQREADLSEKRALCSL